MAPGPYPLDELEESGDLVNYVTAVGSSQGLAQRLDLDPATGTEFGKIMVQLTSPTIRRRHQEDIIAEIREESDLRKAFLSEVFEKGYAFNREADFCTKAGDFITGLLSTKKIVINDVPHLLTVVRDITDRKRAENREKQLESQLLHAQKMEAIGTFAGGI